MPEPQNFANHVRRARPLEYAVAIPLAANAALAAFRLLRNPTFEGLIELSVAIALVALLWVVRTQILTVQNRVIRNEMRQRLQQVLPADLNTRAASLPVPQLAALRFAGDSELPELVREVLDGRLTTPKEIKMRVRNWQADYLRA